MLTRALQMQRCEVRLHSERKVDYQVNKTDKLVHDTEFGNSYKVRSRCALSPTDAM